MIEYTLAKNSDVAKITKGTLYHYTDGNALQNILEKKVFWITKSNFLNDPSELSYIDEIMEDANEKLRKEITKKHNLDAIKDLASNEILESMNIFQTYKVVKNDMYRDVLDNVYILSLTSNQDSLTLWSNYSNLEGYNLGLDSTKLFSILDSNKIKYIHGKVVYDKEDQLSIILKLHNENIEPRMLVSKLALYSCFFKNPLYKAEEEYRILFFITDKDQIKFRNRDGIIIPYVEMPIETKISKNLPLQNVMIGPKNKYDIAEHGINYLLKHLNYNLDEIKVNRSKIPLRY